MMRKEIFLIIALITQFNLLSAQNGSNCEEAFEITLDEFSEHNLPESQSQFYFIYTGDEENLQFIIQQLDDKPITEFDSLTIYKLENCEELENPFSRAIYANKGVITGLDTSKEYLFKFQPAGEAAETSSFQIQFSSFNIYPCPTYYPTKCNELTRNGGFTYTRTQNIAFNYQFSDSLVCEWYGAFNQADMDYFGNNAYANLYARSYNSNPNNCAGIFMGIEQAMNLKKDSNYILNFKLIGKHFLINRPFPNNAFADSFKVYLSADTALTAAVTSTWPTTIRDYCTFKNQVTYKQEIATVLESEMDTVLKNFTFCFTPDNNYNRIIFVPITNKQAPNHSYTGLDSVSVQRFVSPAAKQIVYLDSCNNPKRIGPSCEYRGVNYTWSNITNISNQGIRNPFAFAKDTTDFILTISTPSSSCSIYDTITVIPNQNNSSVDYIIPDSADVSWVAANIPATVSGGNTFANKTFFLNGDLMIDTTINGQPVTFRNCVFYVVVDGEIIVSTPKGLVLDNTELTVCGDFLWDGIRLHGDSSLQQTLQPWVEMKNNSEISFAKVGISNSLLDLEEWYLYMPFRPIKYGTLKPSTTGGYIKCRDSKFLNNDCDIHYDSYISVFNGAMFPELTEIYNTEFITTQQSPFGLRNIFKWRTSKVSLHGVYGLKFGGCSFENTDFLDSSLERGTAISARLSSFSLFDYNENGTTVRSSISGFEQGIITGMDLTNSLYIAHADFTNNLAAINVAGGDVVNIFKNTFDIPDHTASYGTNSGLLISGGNEYYIDENEFSYTGAGTANSAFGLGIIELDNYENVIYNNNFENLNVGTLVIGDNRDANNQGLVIKCNDYDANNFHIALEPKVTSIYIPPTPPEIALKQGGDLSETDPAGNTFNDLCTGSTETDISVDSTGSDFDYYHHTNSVTTPLCRNQIKVTNMLTTYFFDKELACPSNFQSSGGGGLAPGPSLVRHDPNGLAAQLRNLNSSNKSGNNNTEKVISQYYAAQMMADTIQLDSIIHYLSQSNNPFNQLRAAAAMQLKGDTNLNNQKAVLGKMSGASLHLLKAHHALQQDDEKTIANIKNDPAHPLYIWAKVKAFVEYNEPLPFPIQLPEAKIKLAGQGNESIQSIVYPVPAQHQLVVKDVKQMYVAARLINLQGKVIKALSLKAEQSTHSVNVSEVPNGVYLLQLINQDGRLDHEKIIIQH